MLTTTPGGTYANQLLFDRTSSGAARGVYISTSGSGNPPPTGVGFLSIASTSAANPFSVNTTIAGTSAWSNANSTWTWTATSNTTMTMLTGIQWAGFTPGAGHANVTRVMCSDGTTVLSPSTPTVSGTF